MPKKLLSVFAGALALIAHASGQNHALDLGPSAQLVFSHDPIMNTGNAATIEGWARADPASVSGRLLFHRYQPSLEHKMLVLFADGRIEYVYAGSPWSVPLTAAGTFPVDGGWHHVAFVRHADGTWQVFVDGDVVLALGPAFSFGSGCWSTCEVINSIAPTILETTTDADGWAVDEWRMSSIDRYSGPFVPSRHWASDAATVMLLSFDEGSGALAHDVGPAQQVGGLSGPYNWIDGAEQPVTYCTAKINSLGCLPAIGSFGQATLSGIDDFHIVASNVRSHTSGLMLWGAASANQPLAGGILCVQSPIVRTLVQSAGGSSAAVDCTGNFEFHFSQSYMALQGLAPGNHVFAQYYSRDPGFAAPQNVGLTNGLTFVIGP